MSDYNIKRKWGQQKTPVLTYYPKFDKSNLILEN